MARFQGKKRQFEIEKQKQDLDKQLTVYRRKYDEVSASVWYHLHGIAVYS